MQAIIRSTTSSQNPVKNREIVSKFNQKAVRFFESFLKSLSTYEECGLYYINFTKGLIEDFFSNRLMPYSLYEVSSTMTPDKFRIWELFNSGEINKLTAYLPCNKLECKNLLLQAIEVIDDEFKLEKSNRLLEEQKAALSEKNVAASKIQNWFHAVQAYSRSAQGTRFRHLTKVEAGTLSEKRRNNRQKKVEMISRGLGIKDGSLDKITLCALGDPIKLSYENVKLFQRYSKKNISLLMGLIKSIDMRTDIKQSFLDKFINFTFDIVHYTSTENSNKRLLSLNTLLSSATFSEIHKTWKHSHKFSNDQISGTPRHDIERLGDCDFVFFHLQPPGQAQKVQSRFGEYFYSKSIVRQDFKDKKILMTLADTAINKDKAKFKKSTLIFNAFIGHDDEDELNHIYGNRAVGYARNIILADLIEESYRDVAKVLDQNQVFVGADALTALGLCALYLYANINKKYSDALNKSRARNEPLPVGYSLIKEIIKNMEAFLMSNLEDHDKLNAIFNGWIRPIVKVPVGVSV